MSEIKIEIKKRLRNLQSLPTLPPVVSKLTKMFGNENTTAPQLAKIIERDQVLTSKVLKMVNSAFYGFPRRISTVSNAIVLLGFNVIRTLVITTSIFEMMQSGDLSLWEHSLGVAAASGILAQYLGLANPEEVTTAGLLHDLGKVVIRSEFPSLSQEISALVKQKKIFIREAEREILGGMDHSHIGQLLTNQWNLPERLTEPIAHHHEPSKSKKFFQETAVVHFADILIRAWGYGYSGDPWVPPLDEKAWEALGLRFQDLEEIIPLLDERILDLRFFTQEIRGEGFGQNNTLH